MPQDLAPEITRLAFLNAQEQDWSGKIEGDLPDWAKGILYLNGPAAFTRGELKRGHWIDGDGLVRRLEFGGGAASFRSRFVKTQRRREEEDPSTAPCRSFGTASPGDRLRRGLSLYTPSNVRAHPFAVRLLTFGEQALPWELDPESLETIGERKIEEDWPDIMPLSAHPKIDPRNGHLCNFGFIYMGTQTRFLYQEWSRDMKLAVSGETELPAGHVVHDCLISEHYACFHLSPYYLDIGQFTRNDISLLDAMQWDADTPSDWLIFSRETGQPLARVPTGIPGFCLHTINAYEEDGQLVLDILEADSPYYNQYYVEPGLFSNIGPSRVRRTRLNCSDWSFTDTRVLEAGLHLDFPCIDPQHLGSRYRHAWMPGMPTEPAGSAKFYDRLLHLDWNGPALDEVYRCPEGRFLSAEPQLIAHPDAPETGLLVLQEQDISGPNTDYVFFDTQDPTQGPRARVRLPFFDPPCFHTALERSA